MLEPRSDVSLAHLLDDTPALKSAFANIDPTVFNAKLDEWLGKKPARSSMTLMTLAYLSHEEPALPGLLDALSAEIDYLAQSYEGNPEEFEKAMNVGSRVMDVDGEALTEGSRVLADILRYFGNQTDLYTSAAALKFPNQDLWANCEDTAGAYDSAKPAGLEESRETLLGLYDILRLTYCVYEGNEPTGEEPGAFVHEFLTALKATGNDMEVEAARFANDMRDDLEKGEESEIRDFERELADWLTRDPDKEYITDYLTNEFYGITRKQVIYEEGRPLLDLFASFISQKDDGEYMSRWLLDSLRADSGNFSQVELYTSVGANVKNTSFYQFADELLDKNQSGLSYNLQNALCRVGGGGGSCLPAGRDRFLELLWDGWTYAGNGGNTSHAGILCINDSTYCNSGPGSLNRMIQERSTEAEPRHFRLLMHDLLNGDGDGLYAGGDFGNDDSDDGSPLFPDTGMRKKIAPTYNGESIMEAFLNNFVLYLIENYYSPEDVRWALTPAEGMDFFGDRSRSVMNVLGGVQYTLRNMAVLNPYGMPPGQAPAGCTGPGCGNATYLNLPYLSGMLYTMAVANGVADPAGAPAQLTLKDSLGSMGAYPGNVGANGEAAVDVLFLTIPVQVACGNDPAKCDLMQDTIYRQPAGSVSDLPYSTDLDMFDFELISPGRFISRDGSTNNGWQGVFRAAQGDVETTDTKTANWVLSEISLSTWEGYGPFTVKGKAPNGSALKYENSYHTDKYSAKVCVSDNGFFGGYNCNGHAFLPLGANKKGNASDYSAGATKNYGNHHIYQKIYRPRDSGDPCWSHSDQGTYAFTRPTGVDNYFNEALACDGGSLSYQQNPGNSDNAKWGRIQVDFESREEAIRANFEWVLKDKKYVFVIPMVGEEDTVLILGSFNVFVTIKANGVMGVTSAKRAGSDPSNNGRWNLSGVTLNLTGNNEVSDGEFVAETAAEGADLSTRFKKTSFEAGDSSITIDMNYYQAGLGGIMDVPGAIWDTLADGPVTPAAVGDNFGPILALSETRYATDDLVSIGYSAGDNDILKFRAFLDAYFPTDEKDSGGNPGSDGSPDLYQDLAGGRLTPEDLPPLPLVNGVSYPESFDQNGQVASWYTHTGPSEAKFGKFLFIFAMMAGTMHEDGTVIDDATGSPLATGENRDNITIRNFGDDGFRSQINSMLDLLTALNESVKQGGNNLPGYNDQAVVNALTETMAGARDGFLPRLLANKYANVANLDPIITDIEELVGADLKDFFEYFQLFKGTPEGGSSISNRDKFRYFFTDNVVKEGAFPDNKLASIGGQPMELTRRFLDYLTRLSEDEDILAAAQKGVEAYNRYAAIKQREGLNLSFLNLSGQDIQDIASVLQSTTSDGDNLIQSLLTTIDENDLNDINTLVNLDIDKFVDFNGDDLAGELEELNDKLAEYLDSNIKKDLLYSSLLMGEPYYDGNFNGRHDSGEPYYDHNGNGEFDAGHFSFRDWTGETYIDETNINGKITLETPVPDIYNFHGYDIRMDTLLSSLDESMSGLTRGDFTGDSFTDTNGNGFREKDEPFMDDNANGKFDEGLASLFHLDFEKSLTRLKRDVYSGIYDDTRFDEPHNDRDGDGVIRPAEAYQDANANNRYDLGESFTDQNGNDLWDPAEFTDINGDGVFTGFRYDGEPFTDTNGNGRWDANLAETYLDADDSGSWEEGEPYIDANRNGEFDATDGLPEPFDDTNGNGVYDGPVTLRGIVSHYVKEYQDFYDDLNNDGIVPVLTKSVDDLLNPKCVDYSKAPITENCQAQNPQYITSRLLEARQKFYDSTDFTPEELNSLKKVLGRMLYNREAAEYSGVVADSAGQLSDIMDAYRGQWTGLLDLGIEGFQPGGLLSYMAGELKPAPQYSDYDVLRDIGVLLDSKVFRYHDRRSTFWWQFADLSRGMSRILEQQSGLDIIANLHFSDRIDKIFTIDEEYDK